MCWISETCTTRVNVEPESILKKWFTYNFFLPGQLKYNNERLNRKRTLEEFCLFQVVNAHNMNGIDAYGRWAQLRNMLLTLCTNISGDSATDDSTKNASHFRIYFLFLETMLLALPRVYIFDYSDYTQHGWNCENLNASHSDCFHFLNLSQYFDSFAHSPV